MTQTNELLTLDLQFFSEDPTEPITPTEPVETPAQPEAKTFSQTELDELIAKRIDRERKKYEKYADYDEIKTKASEYEKVLEEKRLAELSEAERAQDQAKKFEEEKNELTAQLDAVRKQADSEKIRNEFNKVATSANVAYLDDAIALADLSAVSIDEDGRVVGMDDVVKALVDNKPFLVGKKAQQPIGEPSNGGKQDNEKTSEQLLEEAADKAKKSGRIEDRVAFDKLKRQLG
ncbi:hypothetical protein [Sporosarcina psychrophila]|uniref:Vacuolar-type H+-ATPase subunit I/STV1 n=1 Tax=Sporosarcina psychrophila TaxID=1476 RepID=A0ABV2KEJ1_SPOPS